MPANSRVASSVCERLHRMKVSQNERCAYMHYSDAYDILLLQRFLYDKTALRSEDALDDIAMYVTHSTYHTCYLQASSNDYIVVNDATGIAIQNIQLRSDDMLPYNVYEIIQLSLSRQVASYIQRILQNTDSIHRRANITTQRAIDLYGSLLTEKVTENVPYLYFNNTECVSPRANRIRAYIGNNCTHYCAYTLLSCVNVTYAVQTSISLNTVSILHRMCEYIYCTRPLETLFTRAIDTENNPRIVYVNRTRVMGTKDVNYNISIVIAMPIVSFLIAATAYMCSSQHKPFVSMRKHVRAHVRVASQWCLGLMRHHETINTHN